VADEKRLLIPIDGSENSLRALSHVIKRAVGDKQLHLYVLNVQPALPSSLFVTRTIIASHHEAKSMEALIHASTVVQVPSGRRSCRARRRAGRKDRQFRETKPLRRDCDGHARTWILQGSAPRFHHDESHSRSASSDNGRALMRFRPCCPEKLDSTLSQQLPVARR